MEIHSSNGLLVSGCDTVISQIRAKRKAATVNTRRELTSLWYSNFLWASLQLYLNNRPFITLYMSFKFPGFRGWRRVRWRCSSETALLPFSNLMTVNWSSEQKLCGQRANLPTALQPLCPSFAAATCTKNAGVTQMHSLGLLWGWRGIWKLEGQGLAGTEG